MEEAKDDTTNAPGVCRSLFSPVFALFALFAPLRFNRFVDARTVSPLRR
jgi:hypothetical protein